MGVGCKLVQFVVFCVLFVMMLTNIEINSAVSEEGHVLTAYGFFLVHLRLKIYIDPSA